MYIFIVNPVAGSGKARKIHQKLMNTKYYKRLQPTCYQTQYKNHASELVENLRSIHRDKDITAIIVIGGDGTMHEVLNGLKKSTIPIAFIPGGSGNDFVRGANLIQDPGEVLQSIISKKKPSHYWIGLYEINQRKQKIFMNCIGFGFDAVVARSANQLITKKWLNQLKIGSVNYLIAIFLTLITYKPYKITVEVDGDSLLFERCFLISVNNHPYFGGGMKINPNAVNKEQELSVVIINDISKWKVLTLFGSVFTGKHLQFKEVHTFKGKVIQIITDVPIPYQVDGETGTTQFAKIKKRDTPIKIIGRS